MAKKKREIIHIKLPKQRTPMPKKPPSVMKDRRDRRKDRGLSKRRVWEKDED